MEKSLASKKEMTNRNNNATGGQSSNQKSSALKDPRPLRDPNFLKIAKQKLLKFLENTEYPRKFDTCMFTKLTQSDVKTLFEHFITLIDPDFRLNDSQISPEERIINFFNTIQYKNSFSKTHITSPTIVSSVPFVIGVFDYLRRIVTNFLSTSPSMFFPRLTEYSISCEIILGPLISIHKKLESEEFVSHDLIALQDLLEKEIGVKSDEEIAAMSKKVDTIEELLENIGKAEVDIESIAVEHKHECDSMEIHEVEYEREKKSIEGMQLEILEERKILECEMKEKSDIEREKSKFEEMGHGEKINQIEDLHQKLITIRSQQEQLKLELETSKQTSKEIFNEIDQIKLQSQKQFAEVKKIFPHLIDAEILQVVNDLTSEHLSSYDGLLRPHISKLISAIEAEAQLKKQELADHITLCDNLQKQLDLLNRDNEILGRENQQHVNNIKQNEHILQEIKQKTVELYKMIQDLGNRINIERLANKETEERAIIEKKKLEETKLLYEESSQFYSVDIEFKKESAEIRLQTLQDSWETRQSVLKMNEDFLIKSRERIDLQKNEMEDFASNLMDMLKEDFNDFQ